MLLACTCCAQGNWKARSGWKVRAVKLGYYINVDNMTEAQAFARHVKSQPRTEGGWNSWTHVLADLMMEYRYEEANHRCLCTSIMVDAADG